MYSMMVTGNHVAAYIVDADHTACSYQDLSGFSLGMASILFWLVAQMPQIISNVRNQSAEALSPYFLAEWLLVISFALYDEMTGGSSLYHAGVSGVFQDAYVAFIDSLLHRMQNCRGTPAI